MIRPNVCGYGRAHRLPIVCRDAAARPHSVQTLHHSTSTSTCSRIWKLDCDDSLITLHLTKDETGTNNIWHLMDAFQKLGLLPWCEDCMCLVTGAVPVVAMVSSDHWPVWLPLRPVPAVQLSYRNYFHIFCQAYTTLGGFINALWNLYKILQH